MFNLRFDMRRGRRGQRGSRAHPPHNTMHNIGNGIGHCVNDIGRISNHELTEMRDYVVSG
eukprot:scaffold7283_cov124-Isochrysis_galbana.AAC.4